ncbi:galactosyltransferases [Moesziomyces antarcticus T-34]|uniref:Galactosyltransferases n=1 Tax=Pseudozyma antarctica (strain T-34) TaxID=1151754 RepID=M9LL20_PSEA3|nr:galactosyltransferases [Moesziomyces antarcticus T-34]
MSIDRGSPQRQGQASTSAPNREPRSPASPTAIQRHPFTRTPSNEPPRIHFPREADTTSGRLHPSSGTDATLAVDLSSSSELDRASLDASVNGLSSSMDSFGAHPADTLAQSANPHASSATKYWPEPSGSHLRSAPYAVNDSDSQASYPQHERNGPHARIPRLHTKAIGYTSSNDGDLTPIASTSRMAPPLVGVNLTDQQIADMTESDVSEYDDTSKLRRNRRGSGADPAATSVFSSITKSLRGEPFWSHSATSYTPLTATRSRSLKKSKWNRNSKTDKALFSSSTHPSSKDRTRPRRTPSIWTHPLRMILSFFSKLFRTAFGPIHPVTIILALVLIASFVASVTKLIIYILNPDKEPLPWRTYCQQQPAFPHAYADALAPVDVFVGVFSIDSAYERRHLIRSTYATHTMPLDPHTGTPTSNVQVKFIIGKPRQAHARRVALEMETFNDIVVLDMEENMNRGKTHAFFRWAAENATVPFLRAVEDGQNPASGLAQGSVLLSEPESRGQGHGQTREVLGGSTEQMHRYQVLWKKADYVVKADDDAFLILEELERHLRVAPRQMTYWGYLIRNWFMGGECYALSNDLVQYVAKSENVLHYIKGKEDKKVAQWINLHPNRSSIHWVSEHCWIYDHPKAGTAYSHGFLFPDYVEKIKLEGRRGLTDQEIARRGGEHRAKSYSTVSRWHSPYVEPRGDLTIEEEVEALVEGGGRWSGSWVRGEEGNDTQIWVPWQQIVFEANDERLRPPILDNLGAHPTLAEEVGIDPATGLTVRHIHAANRQTSSAFAQADDDAVHAQRRKRDIPFLAHLPSVPGFDFGAGGVSRSAAEDRKRSFASSAMQPRMIPLPTHKDGNGEAEELRRRRYLGRRFGGTVVVHYLKKSEWFYETALAFAGRGRFWPDGAGGTGSEWRMYGSPLVRHEDGYISGGRSQPRPDMELAYLQQARVQAQANAAQAQQLSARMGSFTKPKPAAAGGPPPPKAPPQNSQPPMQPPQHQRPQHE